MWESFVVVDNIVTKIIKEGFDCANMFKSMFFLPPLLNKWTWKSLIEPEVNTISNGQFHFFPQCVFPPPNRLIRFVSQIKLSLIWYSFSIKLSHFQQQIQTFEDMHNYLWINVCYHKIKICLLKDLIFWCDPGNLMY